MRYSLFKSQFTVRDYSSSSYSSSSASAASSRSARIEMLILFDSSSMSIILTSTTSPTETISLTFSTFLSASCEMWIRPSTPSIICANAPKLVVETIVALTTSSTAYCDLKISQGLSSAFLKPREILFSSALRSLMYTSRVSPTETTSLGCLTRFHESSEI